VSVALAADARAIGRKPMKAKILEGNVLETLKDLPACSVQCVVTSPPYYGLRDYGMSGQIGNEPTPEAYVEKLVFVFREVKRVLKDDGTLWLNLGDSYWGGKGQSSQAWSTEHQDRNTLERSQHQISGKGETRPTDGKHPVIKPKDLIGIPWMVAFALRADGWYLRQEIIWNKPNPMPESVTDRCTKSHEQIFLLTKSKVYYFDQAAIREPAKDSSVARLAQDVENQEGSSRANGGKKTNGKMKAVKFGGNKAEGYGVRTKSGKEWIPTQGGGGTGFKGHSGNMKADGTLYVTANKKTVWTVSTKPYREAHFATYPPDLIEPCILAGTKEGDTVLDPFNGSGTTGEVSIRHNRLYIGCELNPEYIRLTNRRLSKVQPFMPSIRTTQPAPDAGESAPSQAFSTPDTLF
jgi:DNA modification methylase